MKFPDKYFKVISGEKEVEMRCAPGKTHDDVLDRITRVFGCSDAWVLLNSAQVVIASHEDCGSHQLGYMALHPGTVLTLSQGISITLVYSGEKSRTDRIRFPPDQSLDVLRYISDTWQFDSRDTLQLQDLITLAPIEARLTNLVNGRAYSLVKVA